MSVDLSPPAAGIMSTEHKEYERERHKIQAGGLLYAEGSLALGKLADKSQPNAHYVMRCCIQSIKMPSTEGKQ